MDNNIDTLFKKALKDRSCEPPSHIWDGIEQQLIARRKRKATMWVIRGAAAIALLLSMTWLLQIRTEDIKNGYLHLSSSENREDSIRLINEIKNLNDSIKTTPPQFAQSISSNPSVNTIKLAESHKTREIVLPVKVLSNNADERITNPKPISTKMSIRKNFIPLVSKAAIENNHLYQKLLTNNQIKRTDETDGQEKEKIQISMSGHIAPVYSSGSYKSSVKGPRGVGYSKSQMNGVVNVSGGLKLSIATSKRLSVQTGLFYTKMGQNTTESNVYVPRTAAFSTHTENSNVTTPLGNVKSKAQAVVYKSESIMALNNIKQSDSHIEQIFGALEIPLAVKYRLNNNKVQFNLIGGFSGSFIVDNQAYLSYNGEKESMGSTEDIKKFNISTDIGLGVEYPITRKIRIIMEPGFKYYLQSISRNREIDFKPYQFSFSTGIGIDF